ncbi:MAG: chorismate mutase [Euryhalocaulis sp.]|nr:chorismate mutase [Euryhalocaulis sp.]
MRGAYKGAPETHLPSKLRHIVTEYKSDPRQNTANECQSMPEVRHEVDRLDRLLVRLIAERQTYMEAAARIKPDRNVVRDEARIRDVLEKVLAEAAKHGLSADIAEPVWRAMMEACIAHEFEAYDALRKSDTVRR